MPGFNKQKYDTQYAKENYDRCIFNVPKGQKAVIEQHWRSKGYKSLNAYVNALIEKDMRESRYKRFGIATVKVASGRKLDHLRKIARVVKAEEK